MRKLMDLTKLDEKGTFVYFRTPDLCKKFMRAAEDEGFTFGDGGLPSKRDTADIFAIHEDKTITYVGSIGHIAFQANARVRVDYEKYIAGEEDYLFKS